MVMHAPGLGVAQPAGHAGSRIAGEAAPMRRFDLRRGYGLDCTGHRSGMHPLPDRHRPVETDLEAARAPGPCPHARYRERARSAGHGRSSTAVTHRVRAGVRHARRIAVLVTTAAAAVVAAQQPSRLAADQPPADLSAADLLQSARAEVRIIARENHELEEYRVGNNVYMIKVKPSNAPPYYLIDQDGSGNLEWKRGSDLERISVPHWAVFQW